jgi:integral membrane protein
MNFSSSLSFLRLLALLEGISYLLLAITFPIKKIYGIEGPNFWVGMTHGILFITYCVFVLLVAKKYSWSFGKTVVSGFASLIPIGTFVADAKIFKPEQANTEKPA